MGTLTIRDLDDAVKDRLRVRAATNGRSMEAEARAILAAAVGESDAYRRPGVGASAPWSARVVKPATSRQLPRIRRALGGPSTQEILDELRADQPLGDGPP
jgi:plasmid stability protein